MQIKFVDIIDSTNLYLYTKADEDRISEDTALVSYEQTGGKGRRGRKFFSPGNTGVYVSLLLHPDATVRQCTLITTMMACAAARALEMNNSPNIRIKWVNDLYVDNKKVGGILTECSSKITDAKPKFVVVGVGINLFWPDEGFPDDISDRAGAVFKDPISSEDKASLRDKIAIDIVNCFEECYSTFPNVDHFEDYKRRLFIINRTVQIVDGPKVSVLDIDEDFGLVVKMPDGEVKSLDTGEVSLII